MCPRLYPRRFSAHRAASRGARRNAVEHGSRLDHVISMESTRRRWSSASPGALPAAKCGAQLPRAVQPAAVDVSATSAAAPTSCIAPTTAPRRSRSGSRPIEIRLHRYYLTTRPRDPAHGRRHGRHRRGHRQIEAILQNARGVDNRSVVGAAGFVDALCYFGIMASLAGGESALSDMLRRCAGGANCWREHPQSKTVRSV